MRLLASIPHYENLIYGHSGRMCHCRPSRLGFINIGAGSKCGLSKQGAPCPAPQCRRLHSDDNTDTASRVVTHS